MRKLIFVTSSIITDGSSEFDNWKGGLDTDYLQVVDGLKFRKKEGVLESIGQFLKNEVDGNTRKSIETGVLIHLEAGLVKKIKEDIKSSSSKGLAFIEAVSTQASEQQRRIDYDLFSDYPISKLNLVYKSGGASDQKEVVDQFYSFFSSQEFGLGQSLDMIFPKADKKLDLDSDKCLLLAPKNEYDYLKQYINETYSFRVEPGFEIPEAKQSKEKKDKYQRTRFYGFWSVEELETCIRALSPLESSGSTKTGFQNLFSRFDAVIISPSFAWNSNSKTGGIELAQELIEKLTKPISIALSSTLPQDIILGDLVGLAKRTAEILPHYILPLNENIAFKKLSDLKWGAYKLSQKKEDLFNKWLHDIKYIVNLKDLQGFYRNILSYQDIIPLKDLEQLELIAISEESFDEAKTAVEVVLANLVNPTIKPERLKGFKVLLVEDDAHQRAVITEALGDYFEEVVSVSTGQEAITQLKREEFQLLICDINLEESVGGYKVQQKVWGIDVLEFALEISSLKKAILTSLPKDYIEILLAPNKHLKKDVEVLYKHPSNRYLPLAYRWNQELALLSQQVAKKHFEQGPKNGDWKLSGLKGDFYNSLSQEQKETLWGEVEKKLIQKDFDKYYLSEKQITNTTAKKMSFPEKYEWIRQSLIIRAIVLILFEDNDTADWNEFCIIDSNRDQTEYIGSNAQSTWWSTKNGLGFSRTKGRLILKEENIFPEEIKLRERVFEDWSSLMLDLSQDEDLYDLIVAVPKMISKQADEFSLIDLLHWLMKLKGSGLQEAPGEDEMRSNIIRYLDECHGRELSQMDLIASTLLKRLV